MAVYKWRIPMLAALQFDGKNHKAVKELIGDTSDEKEKFMVGTGKFEEPEAPPEPEPTGEASEEIQGDQAEVPGTVTGDTAATVKVAPAEPPKEILEELAVSEGDWVTKDIANGKIEVNPEGFPDKYEFISG